MIGTNDIADVVAEDFGLTKVMAKKIVKRVFGHIESSVNSGDTVRVHGFGAFSLKHIKREGVAPTGAHYSVDRYKIAFKAAKKG